MARAKAAVSSRRATKPARKTAASPAKTKIAPAKIAAKRTHPKSEAGKPQPKHSQNPIALYYWPTPNGWKISIMLEECGLLYELRPVNISKGEQFDPSFLKFAPNNRMPAIVDPDGPDGKPISVFESGAILQYLGRKTGKFYPLHERKRVAVDEWLFWQVAGLGPMAGQAGHFRNHAKDNHYGIRRYMDEVHRLLGVMNKRLDGRYYLADEYSIADMACVGWIVAVSRYENILAEFSNVSSWLERLRARPAVQRGLALGKELREASESDPKVQEEARKILFGQRAR